MSKVYNSTTAALKTVTHDTTFLDAQKISVNPGNGNFDERVDVGSSLFSNKGDLTNLKNSLYGNGVEKIYNTNIFSNTNDNASITCFELSRKHFISGYLKNISFKWNGGANASNTGYLAIQICDLNGNTIAIYYSNNTQSFADTSASNAIASFDFDEVFVPYYYKSARFTLVSSKSVIPNGTNGTNCLNFRCKPITIHIPSDSNAKVDLFDDDECAVYFNSTKNNWVVDLSATYLDANNGIIDKLESHEKEVRSLRTETIYQKITKYPSISSKPENPGDCDGITLDTSKIPHNVEISAIEIPLSLKITTPTYIVAYRIDASSNRTIIGCSSNGVITDTDISNAIWKFDNPIIIAEGEKLALYITNVKNYISNNVPIHPNYYISCYQLGSGTDSIRYGNQPYNRDVYVIFHSISETKLVNEKISEIENEINVHEADTVIHLTTDEKNELTSLIENKDNLALLNKENVFQEIVTFSSPVNFNKEIIVNDSINVQGGNLYVSKNSKITYFDDGEVTIENGASGYPVYNIIPTIVSNGAIYNVGVIESDLNLSGITFDGDNTLVQSCEIWFTTGATIYNITWPDNVYWIDYDNGLMPTLLPNIKYRIVLRREIDDVIASISHYYAVR